MKVKTRLKLILALLFVMVAALIGGCTIGQATYEGVLKDYNLTALVTYYGNGGYFNSSTATLYRLMGYREGSSFYNIQSSDTSTTVTRGSEWTFVGWYYIETVEIDGEQYFVCEDDTVPENFTITEDEEEVVVVIDYEGQLVVSLENYELLITRYADVASDVPLLKLADEVDTSMKVSEGHIYIAAKWVVAQGVNYQLVMADGGSKITYSYKTTDDNGETVTNTGEFAEGEIMYTDYFGTSSSLTVFSSSLISTINSSYSLTDGTWLEYYLDEDCTQVASGTIAKPESGDITIYALFTTGTWNVVKDSSNVKTMFSSTSRDYYVLYDIDCSSLTVSAMDSFAGTINGNGHTISGLTVSVGSTDLKNNGYCAMFGDLRNDATIKDITFDNLTLNYTTSGSSSSSLYCRAYMLFSGVLTGATPTVENVTFSNATMNLTVNTGMSVMNIQDETDTENWLYTTNRDDDETDAGFEAEYGFGITFDNVKLIYNGTEIAVLTAE